MFYAASVSGKKFIGKKTVGGEIVPSWKIVYEKSEAFEFATAEEANTAAKTLMRKDAGEAVEVSVSAPKSVQAEYIPSLPRPTRHQREEAAIHGDHELYT